MKTVYYFNGERIEKSDSLLQWDNRAFRYADAFFESMRVIDGKLLLWKYHYNRILFAWTILKMPKSLSSEELSQSIRRALKESEIEHGMVRLIFYRKAGGKYLPDNLSFDYVMEIQQGANHYPEQNNTYKVGSFGDIPKHPSLLQSFKSTQAGIYTLAALYAKEQHWDDALLLNPTNMLVEATSSNIFLRYKGALITPPLIDGCVRGVVREALIDFCYEHKQVLVEESFGEPELQQAEEVFLSNAFWGIRVVSQFQNTQFEQAFTATFRKQFLDWVINTSR